MSYDVLQKVPPSFSKVPGSFGGDNGGAGWFVYSKEMAVILWNDVVEDYYTPIYRFCLHFSGDQSEAEELTQDTFLKAHKSIGNINDPSKIKAWLYSIAKNTCRDRYRWWKRRPIHHSEIEISDHSLSCSPLAMTILGLINKLPTKQREVFILRQLHGFSTEETATLLSISAGTVKSHLKRAIDRLKLNLEGDLSPDLTSGTTDRKDQSSNTVSEETRP